MEYKWFKPFTKMLLLKNIHKSFYSSNFKFKNLFIHRSQKNDVLKGINLTLDKRQILGLTGSNGSGKSTLLRIISGLIEKDRGEIHFENFNSQNVALISSNERSFYWRLTTYQNLIFFGSIYNLSKKEIDFKLENLKEILDIEDILEKPIMILSSGQRKKVMLARAFLKNPKLILCDEFLTNLDEESQANSKTFLKNYIEEKKASIIWVSHSIEEINNFCDRNIELMEGVISH